jgi:hypothetical protein
LTFQHRLVLVLDDELARVHATAEAVRAKVPGVRTLVLDAERGDAAYAVLPDKAGREDSPPPDVVLVRASPASWAAASVLAVHRHPRLRRQVDAFLIAEGPLDMLPVLITDYPGLRVLPPGTDVAKAVAEQLLGNDWNHRR